MSLVGSNSINPVVRPTLCGRRAIASFGERGQVVETVVVLPRQAWEQFLADSDEGALLAVIRRQPRRPPPQDVDYPEWHRVCDVQLCGEPYRVLRLVDVVDGEERLFAAPGTTPEGEKRGGVPYWLQGEALLHWITDETARPAKGPIDWEQYRPGR
jgi:hypothetical protein